MVHLSMSAEINQEYKNLPWKWFFQTVMIKKWKKKWWKIFFLVFPTDSKVQGPIQK